MEELINFLSENPLYAAGAAVLLLFLVIALIKKMVKVAILAVALNLAYGYYLQDIAEDFYAKTRDKTEDMKDKAEDLFDEAGEIIKR